MKHLLCKLGLHKWIAYVPFRDKCARCGSLKIEPKYKKG